MSRPDLLESALEGISEERVRRRWAKEVARLRST